ncbi:DDE superfamily endonuclease [Micromonospora inyonensis]|uniref:DDE superfamily endonuclease n=1 Tax=Micromonospora inyonensis TaxID=47866 RepID=A0A1C6S5N5_9ACTN|nr:DDE superfamily endonuclease [Micromonospora inyonensis]
MPVSGKGSGRVSIRGLTCYKPGRRPRLIYRTVTHRGRKGERRSFAEADYIALLDAAHQQLGGPIVLVWDNLNTHISAATRQMIAGRDWLTVIRLPAYAPDLNPTEGVAAGRPIVRNSAACRERRRGTATGWVRCGRWPRVRHGGRRFR